MTKPERNRALRAIFETWPMFANHAVRRQSVIDAYLSLPQPKEPKIPKEAKINIDAF